jgi:multidrug efflux pump subunit AcrA (membrane-fusion protein)
MATSGSPLISVGGVQADESSYVDWPAIFAGTLFATGLVLTTAVSDGALNDADRQYLTTTIAARAGLDEAQAQQRVDALLADAQAAEAEARQAAETARKVAMIAAFVTAASFLVSAVGAYYGATLGGNHRDNKIVFADWRRSW